ncbi:MAG: protease [Chloroflexi bacterium]|nr:MAG: protease [Chloroflexota bacterium]
MANELKGKKVAILATNGFEEIELTDPKRALEEAGAETHIVSPETGTIFSWQSNNWGSKFPVDVPVAQANADNYDALLIPGGVMNPDKLRLSEESIEFIRAFFDAGKPVAAICHGPWPLIDAGVVEGRMMTSYPSLRMDLINAGAEWVDREVVVDNGLVTSRNPDDLPAFNRKIVEEFAEGVHEPAMA